MKKFSITVSEQELNIILQSLAKQSFEIVYPVIMNIQKQIHQAGEADEEQKPANNK